MATNSLARFVIKIFLFLPLCYWFWYYSADFTSWVAARMTEPLLKSWFPDLVMSVDQIGRTIEVAVKATLQKQNVPQGMVADMPIQLNPLIYNYCLPLYVSLTLASPEEPMTTLRNILIGIFLLLPVQIWGISFELMKIIFLQTPAHLIGNITLPQWQLDAIAIGYQVGTLVLPPVAPIMIWLFLYRNFVVRFMPEKG